MGSRNRGNVKCFSRDLLETREMLNMLNVFGDTPPQKALKTGEMLHMLNMLSVLGEIGLKNAQTFDIFNTSPVLSILDKEHLTFPLFRGPGFTK